LLIATAMNEPVAIAILAKAPAPGFAKTRLIPVLGAERAALLQAALIERTAQTACAAAVGPVTLWATPDDSHRSFQAVGAKYGISIRRQAAGDLGERMLAAMTAANAPVLVVGTDCPALTPAHLRCAADMLLGGSDAVVLPAEDGGYVLIGTRSAQPALFADMRWGSSEVMEATRRRLRKLGLSWQEPATLWDLDVAEDLSRLRELGLEALLR
jgi:uncharacterized protein